MREKIEKMKNELFHIRVNDIFFSSDVEDCSKRGEIMRVHFQFLDGPLADKRFYISCDLTNLGY